ncbi:MAG: KpsF/GutQ family sugar-phosphate isomerase [Candidatus Sumerlaeales bacterium]|nr:KpsF/GutQ family sugar-phosphate isomerase [Candidatus Sumerlaeales bacterium]
MDKMNNNSLNVGRDVIRQEADALMTMAERMNGDFDKAIELILACKGRIVFTGMGKHGLVARKTAATMSSTGTPCFFLHPAEAAHGDLGMVEKEDLVIAVSNSGNTSEVLGILPYIQRHQNKLIAMVGNINSELAKNADVVLDISVEKEACPLNLAPTTSTTAAIAMGDALAVVLVNKKGFQKDDFALRHPGGTLGKRLLLKVGDIMRAGNNPTIATTDTFDKAVGAITGGMMGAVTVVDENGKMVGIITDGDVRRTFHNAAGGKNISVTEILNQHAADIMTKSALFTTTDTLAVKALSIMEDGKRKIFVLPVLDENGCPVGMVHLHDLVSAGL